MEKYFCPKCKSGNLIFYPLAMYYDYKCEDCKHRFDQKDILKKMPTKLNKKLKLPKVKSFETVAFEDEESWLEFRKGKITGTTHIIAKRGGFLQDYYQIIVDRLGLSEDSEDDRERGKRLESEAVKVFEKETGKKMNRGLVIWVSAKNSKISLSPDSWNNDNEAAEFKCPNLANYVKVLLEQKVPSEYFYQKLQYFIVNKELETLYFGFYNPLFTAKPFFYLTINRKDIQLEADIYEEKIDKADKEIDEVVLKLTNF